MIRFVMKKDPSVGHLQLTNTDNPVQISVKGPVKSFTQADINKGEDACLQIIMASKKWPYLFERGRMI